MSGVARLSGARGGFGIFRDERQVWRPPTGNFTRRYPFFWLLLIRMAQSKDFTQ